MTKPKTYRLTMPLPPRSLSPNARVHWARASRARKLARASAKLAAMDAGLPKNLRPSRVTLAWTFYWPDRRRRDDDNALASTKAHRDALADWLGTDDQHFQTMAPVMAYDKTNPRLELQITCYHDLP